MPHPTSSAAVWTPRSPPGARNPVGGPPAAEASASRAAHQQLVRRRLVELGPRLVGPAVQAHLVTPRHEVGDAFRVTRCVLAFDEERRAEAVPVEQLEQTVVARTAQVVDGDADGRRQGCLRHRARILRSAPGAHVTP